MTTLQNPPTFRFPARPKNGGRWEKARPKHYGTWAYEPKGNGWRAEVHAPTRMMWNRHGDPLSIQGEFTAALDQLESLWHQTGIETFDCEALERRHAIGRGSLFLIDWIPADFLDRTSWDERMAILDEHVARLPYDCRPEENRLYRFDLIPGTTESWEQLQRINREWRCEFWEGFVAKRTDSPYPITPNATTETPHWIKHRWEF